MKPLLPPQVTRLAGLTVAIVAAYFVAHHFLVPASFHKYGWFRGDALNEIASRTPQYAGREACIECHADVWKAQADAKHRTVTCEVCHGPSLAHALAPDTKTSQLADAAICWRCHEANPSRPKTFQQVNIAAHAGKQKCTECHQPHSPMEDPS